jgi:hypothetical protein
MINKTISITLNDAQQASYRQPQPRYNPFTAVINKQYGKWVELAVRIGLNSHKLHIPVDDLSAQQHSTLDVSNTYTIKYGRYNRYDNKTKKVIRAASTVKETV